MLLPVTLLGREFPLLVPLLVRSPNAPHSRELARASAWTVVAQHSRRQHRVRRAVAHTQRLGCSVCVFISVLLESSEQPVLGRSGPGLGQEKALLSSSPHGWLGQGGGQVLEPSSAAASCSPWREAGQRAEGAQTGHGLRVLGWDLSGRFYPGCWP